MNAPDCPECFSTDTVIEFKCAACGHRWTTPRNSIEDHVHHIRTVLRAVSSEEDLEAELASQLCDLRHLYQKEYESFSDDQVEFLKGIREIHAAIESFIEMLEELPLVRDTREAEQYFSKLNGIALSLGDIPVQKRVLREIRALRERLPQLEHLTSQSEHSIRRSRVLQLERDAPQCRCGSHMVVRESKYGIFWGCVTFPNCFKTQHLTAQELDLLEGRT